MEKSLLVISATVSLALAAQRASVLEEIAEFPVAQ
jgi:hypothetical protein